MKHGHLDDVEFSAWALDPGHEPAIGHFETCGECRREAVDFRRAVAAFRGGLECAAERHQIRWSHSAEDGARDCASRTESWRLLPRLIPVTVLAAILLGVMIATRTPKPAPQAASVTGDSALMMEVRQDLNRQAPDALAPAEMLLADLAVEPSSKTSSTTNGRQ